MILLIGIKKFKHKKADNSNNIETSCDNKKGLRTILLNDLDELNAITDDLKVLTYLKLLVQEDFAGRYITDIFHYQSKDMADMYLLELQIETVKSLEDLTEKICQ